MKKTMAMGVLFTLSLGIVTACTSEKATVKDFVPPDMKTEVSYNKELTPFIYQHQEKPLYFSGTLDYVHSVVTPTSGEANGKWIAESDIVLYDLAEEAKGEDEEFYRQKLTQTVDKEKVVEHIEGGFDDPKTFFTDKIILKAPLKEGNHWSQTVTLQDGKDYKAETKIEKMKGEKGKRQIFTATTITGEGFEDYPNNRYEEKSTYEEGKGLISFERFFPNEEGGFVFEYHLSSKKDSGK